MLFDCSMPFAGAGGAGVIVAKLPDGSWSAPSSVSPNNLSVGAMLGVDVYDCILVINTDEAMETFKSWKVTLGAEMAVTAGPYGAGAVGEMGSDRSPVYSYSQSRRS
jgi:lipid-binding SYLF domain-containing protein